MTAQIRIANTTEDLDAAYKLRHAVVNQEGEVTNYGLTYNGRLYDMFDALDTSTTFIAFWEGRLAGTIRVTLNGPSGFSLDRTYGYDISKALERCRNSDGTLRDIATISYLCVPLNMRRRANFVNGLFRSAMRFLHLNGISDLLGIVHIKLKPMVQGVGLQDVGFPFFDEKVNCQLQFVHGKIRSLLSAKWVEPDLPLSPARCYFTEGDTVFKEGEPAPCLYSVVRGTVELAGKDRNGVTHSLGVFGPGEVFGEDVTVDCAFQYTATAFSNCEVAIVSDQSKLEFLSREPRTMKNRIQYTHLHMRSLTQAVREPGAVKLSGLRLFNDFMLAKTLFCMTRLGFFEYVEKHPKFTCAEVSRAVKVSFSFVEIIFEYLAGLNILVKDKFSYSFHKEALVHLTNEMRHLEFLMGSYDPVLKVTDQILRRTAVEPAANPSAEAGTNKHQPESLSKHGNIEAPS